MSPVTVVETRAYLARIEGLLDDEDQSELIGYIAYNPMAGDLIPDTGGIRKLRWSAEGRGKRGGVRIIYYFHSDRMPIYLLTVYAKNQQENLTPEQKRLTVTDFGVKPSPTRNVILPRG